MHVDLYHVIMAMNVHAAVTKDEKLHGHDYTMRSVYWIHTRLVSAKKKGENILAIGNYSIFKKNGPLQLCENHC